MRFYKPADYQPCYYCEKIAEVEQQKDYPIREGIYTFEEYVYRCAWHSRFTCSVCGMEHHFSWFYWCPSKEKLVCGDCTQPTMKPVSFWDRTYAYQFYCEDCEDYHLDILYTEFQGAHPWQLGNQNLHTIVESSEPWNPIWIPNSKRKGEKIELIDAIKFENRVKLLRKDLNYPLNYEVVRYAVPEDEVEYSKTQKSWEENSQNWLEFNKDTTSGDPNRMYVIDPALWKLLGNVNNLKILDAGCGNGYLTRELATNGANAIGVDFSKPFIDYCLKNESEKNLGCQFFQSSITDMKFLESHSLDVVVSNIVMVDVSDYKTAFKEIARVLKDDGRFIWSNVHPVFGRGGSAMDPKIPQDSKRNESRYLKVIDRYFDSGGHLMNWMSVPIWQFYRTFEEYSRALKDAGFVISEIVEPRPTLELIQQHPRELAFDADRWTHFIIFECLKYPRKVNG